MPTIARDVALAGRVAPVALRSPGGPRGGSAWSILRRYLAAALPFTASQPEARAWRWRNLLRGHALRGLGRILVATVFRIPTHYGVLTVRLRRASGEIVDLGTASFRVITTAGVGFLVDAWQNLVEPEIMKYHGCGTGTTAEAVGDTALVTESTTILNPDSTRATGTLAEGASANIFRSVGTVTFDGSGAITEHGLFSQAATGGGVLFDRSVFAAINVASGDSIQFTYDATLTAGG
ncbi:MAG: hypothetical protein AB7G23_19140 [Vicinamibacterales bacterium]